MPPALFHRARFEAPGLLPDGALGIDAGLTLTKFVRARAGTIEAAALMTSDCGDHAGLLTLEAGAAVGVTGARASLVAPTGVAPAQEIDAAARGARVLQELGGGAVMGDFVLALLGTGTAFAAVRGAAAQHLGGTALGGGSFFGIARRVAPELPYDVLVAGAARGDRRNADIMLFDAYPGGLGRLANAEMTAAHLAKAGAGVDDFLAGLLNLHGESIGQIAASRATISGIRDVMLAGGFAHENEALTTSIASMCALFGVRVEVAPWPGYAGALGAALLAAGEFPHP